MERTVDTRFKDSDQIRQMYCLQGGNSIHVLRGTVSPTSGSCDSTEESAVTSNDTGVPQRKLKTVPCQLHKQQLQHQMPSSTSATVATTSIHRRFSDVSKKSYGLCAGVCNKWLLIMAVMTVVVAGCAGEISHKEMHRRTGRRSLKHSGIDPNEFLFHFGYLPNNHDTWHHFRQSRKQAISLYQKTNGLSVTGRLNNETWTFMQQPRCGNPDLGREDVPEVTSLSSPSGHRVKRYAEKRAKQINGQEFKWLGKKVTWRPQRFFTKMSLYTQWKVLKHAFDKWSEPSGLTLAYDPVNPDIRVAFVSREHGDGNGNAFDGRGKLLAHAFPPGDVDLAGDIHFDADEPWAVGKSDDNNKDLNLIALHEVGHAVGLSHSPRQSDIMYPVYGMAPRPALSKNDVRRLQRLYGKNPDYVYVKPPKPPKPPPVVKIKRVKPRWCRMHFNDVIRGPYGYGYVFSRRYVYRFTVKGLDPGYPVHVRTEFPGAPINPLAVVHVREGTRTFFFKGKRFWRFTNHTLDHGYPRRLNTAFPEKPRAALNVMDRKGHSSIFIFGTKFFWQWSFDSEDVSSSFLFINKFWGGLPDTIDAAVQWNDGYIYFFRHNKYYKVNKDNHDVELGYPKIKGPAWLRGDCGYAPK